MFSKKIIHTCGESTRRPTEYRKKKVNEGNAENHKDTDRKHSETKEPELRPNQ